jgi:hypothetical protein
MGGKHRRSRTSLYREQGVTRHSRATGNWQRRSVLAVAALGGAGAIVGASGLTGSTGPMGSQPAEATEMTVEPIFGAGLFDVDPDQGAVSQDPNTVVTSDMSMLPEDWGF